MPARPPSVFPRLRESHRTVLGLSAPSLIAVANVLAFYSNTSSHWSAAVRPIVVSLLVALLATITILAISRRIRFTIAAGTAGIGLTTGHPLAVLGSVAIILWAIREMWLRIHGRTTSPFPVSAVLVPAAFGFALVTAWIPLGGAISPIDFAGAPRGAKGVGNANPRNLYIILLDGYPRADTLREQLQIDNAPFLNQLASQGFTIYPNAKSPTTRTERTLLSMLSTPSDPIEDEPPHWQPGDLPLEFRRETRRSYQSVGGPKLARQAGYRLVHIAPPSTHLYLADWDVRIAGNHLTELEVELLQQSPVIAPLAGNWVLSELRGWVEDGLRSLPAEARSPGRKVVLAHIVAPHPPLIYGSSIPACWASGCSIWAYQRETDDLSEPYATNLRELNRRVIDALEQVIMADPSASIVVMSDHGLRENQLPSEWRRSLLAARGTSIFDHEATVAHLLYRWLTSHGN